MDNSNTLKPALAPGKAADKVFKEHSVSLVNRQSLLITGVEKVHSINEEQAHVIAAGEGLLVMGQGMSVSRLIVDEGVLEISGEVFEIRYLKQREKTSVFKKFFK